ncbi:MAG: hypothetical protein WCJ31_02500 [Planctomycetia bacterium]
MSVFRQYLLDAARELSGQYDFTRIEQAVGGLLVDRPRRNILRRAGAGSGGAA